MPYIIDGHNAKGRPLVTLKAALSSPVRHVIVSGGNASGKSTAKAVAAYWTATGTHPYRKTPRPPVYLRDFTETEVTVDTILLPRYRELYKAEELRGGSWDKAYERGAQRLYFANGSLIRFCTYTQEVRVQQGERVHANYFDEAPPQTHFQEAQARMGPHHRGESFSALTPWDPNRAGTFNFRPWIMDHLAAVARNNPDCPEEKRNPDVEVFYLSSYDNPEFKDEDVEKMARGCVTKAERDARILGKLTALAGLRFPHFSKDAHFVKPFSLPDDATYYGALDWHEREFAAGMFAFVVPKGDIYFYNLFFDGIGPKIADVAQAIQHGRQHKDLQAIVADCSALGLPSKDSGKTGIELFHDEGITLIKAPHGQAAMTNRYNILDAYLYNSLKSKQQESKRCVYFFDTPEMQRFIWEMSRLVFKEHLANPELKETSQKVLPKDNHAIDCASMLLQYDPIYWSATDSANYSYFTVPDSLSGIEVSLSA